MSRVDVTLCGSLHAQRSLWQLSQLWRLCSGEIRSRPSGMTSQAGFATPFLRQRLTQLVHVIARNECRLRLTGCLTSMIGTSDARHIVWDSLSGLARKAVVAILLKIGSLNRGRTLCRWTSPSRAGVCRFVRYAAVAAPLNILVSHERPRKCISNA